MKRLAFDVGARRQRRGVGLRDQHPYGYNDPYYNNGYNNSQAGRAATGAAIGGAGGAAVGAVVPGVSPVSGAVAGAVLGGVARRGDQGPAILSRYPRLLLLRRPVRPADLRL